MKFNTEIILVSLKDVKPFPGNPQVVPNEKMKMMTDYMRKHGWVGQMPVAWFNHEDKSMYWISGHHRAEAAMLAGINERKCEVIVDQRYSWKQAKKDLLMYNNVHGNPDKDLETDIISDLLNNYDLEMDDLVDDIGLSQKEIEDRFTEDAKKEDLSESFGDVFEVVIECEDVQEQEEVYNTVKELGYKCKILTV